MKNMQEYYSSERRPGHTSAHQLVGCLGLNAVHEITMRAKATSIHALTGCDRGIVPTHVREEGMRKAEPYQQEEGQEPRICICYSEGVPVRSRYPCIRKATRITMTLQY